MEKNAKELDQAIEYDRDLGYDYFGAFADTCVFLLIFRMIFLLQPLGRLGLCFRSRFFEVSRPLRSPTCYACMVRLWNDLNI